MIIELYRSRVGRDTKMGEFSIVDGKIVYTTTLDQQFNQAWVEELYGESYLGPDGDRISTKDPEAYLKGLPQRFKETIYAVIKVSKN